MSTYYMPGPGDNMLNQLVRYLTRSERPRPSFPRHIQIQTDSRCNANCVFCGYPDTAKTLPQGKMDDALFKKIADECGRHYMNRISPYLMNEPLLDKQMPERVAYLNKVRKFGTKIKFNTNGALLTEDVSRRLIKAKLRHLWVSVQGYSEETYKKSMGISMGKVLENVDTLLRLKQEMKAKFPKVSITTLHTTIVDHEMEAAYKYWAERDVTFKVHSLDNRSGKDINGLSTKKPKLKRNCDLFLKQAYVLYNGDMIICCHDWNRKVVMGNVREQSIEEIWNSDRYLQLIDEYQKGDFTNLEPCRTCMS